MERIPGLIPQIGEQGINEEPLPWHPRVVECTPSGGGAAMFLGLPPKAGEGAAAAGEAVCCIDPEQPGPALKETMSIDEFDGNHTWLHEYL